MEVTGVETNLNKTAPTEVDRVQYHQDGVRVIEVPTKGRSLDWEYLGEGIATGSWAVLLAGVVLYLSSKNTIKSFLDRHFSLMDSVKSSLTSNAESLKQVSVSNTKLAEAVEAMRHTDEDTANVLRHISGYLPVLKQQSDKTVKLLEDIKTHR